MRTRHYSEEFKARAVQQLLAPRSRGLNGTAHNIGVPSSTLFVWKQKYATSSTMNKNKTGSWSPEQKLQAIIETSAMSDNDLGAYLRKHGLHSSDLKEWRKDFLAGFPSPGRPKKDPEVLELRKDKKFLERDLSRKEKALAEMSARVVLLKKSHEIFGDEEDDE